MSTRIYHPKGSMCGVCRCRDIDCSKMEFSKMPVIKKYSNASDPTVFIVVLCENFEKNT